ncbi:hypothetical protein QBE52_00900 [Clostridiaceae bacterium 35-E11]
MWSIVAILIVAIVMVLYEVPTLIKSNANKELWTFFILLIFGVILSIMESLQRNIPNPFHWLTAIYEPFTKLLWNVLK